MAKGKGKKNSALMRLIGNKNTVTILGLLACVLTLFIGYQYRVGLAIDPVSIPYAKVEIPARTLITSDMVGKIKIDRTYVTQSTNLITQDSQVVNKYASYKTNIPEGSLFYKEVIKEADEMPDAAFANIDDGYTIYSLEVDEKTTFSNSIRAGEYIDLYLSTPSDVDTKRIIYACLVKSIRVLAVKDDRGNNILRNSLAYGTPSQLLFAVEDDMYKLLMRAQIIGGMTLTPVLRNGKYTQEGNQTTVSSTQLIDYINSQVLEMTD